MDQEEYRVTGDIKDLTIFNLVQSCSSIGLLNITLENKGSAIINKKIIEFYTKENK